MDAPTSTITYDDGLYHPSPIPTLASSISTAPATGIASPPSSSLSSGPMISTAIPQATSLPVNSIVGSSAYTSNVDTQPFSSIAFATLISSSSYGAASQKPTSQNLDAGEASSDPKSNRAIATTVVSLLVFFGTIFSLGYFASRKFRRWRNLRWARKKESRWETTPRPEFEEVWSSENILTVPYRHCWTPCNNEPIGAEKEQFDPFKRSLPRLDPLQSYLDYRREYETDPIEQIDEERGWEWATRLSKKSTNTPAATPGLGTGRYRAKMTADVINKQSLRSIRWVKSIISPSSYSQASTSAEYPQYLPTVQLLEAKVEGNQLQRNEDLSPNSPGIINQELGLLQRGKEQRRGIYQSFPSIGASYLLTKLKESISRRSKLSSLDTNSSKLAFDSTLGKWNEIGQWKAEDETERAFDREVEKTIKGEGKEYQTPTRVITHTQELSLAEIPLPTIPVVAWDATVTQNKSGAPSPRGTPNSRRLRLITPSSLSLSSTSAALKAPFKAKRKLPPIPGPNSQA
ncbi:hypothetical protein O181_041580 [Austropuccinia psidii MF-1]|uniref:Uncharacterized protein n=1 Tax=Austropuccinia psidii MF-1 TaxID=1389203 RepID=A0A9Q3HHA3_9BASI|nr:hypothetical protein [Austropuccinia psidii MF-1]